MAKAKNLDIQQVTSILREAAKLSSRKIFLNTKRHFELFERISNLKGFEVIPHLMPLIFSRNGKLQLCIVTLINKLLTDVSHDQVENLDILIRNSTALDINAKYYQSFYSKPGISYVDDLRIDENIRQSLYAVYAMHPDGHVREQGLERLSGLSPITIPVLLIRANDWVNEISNLVTIKIKQILVDQLPHSLMPFLGLLAKLYGKNRYDHSTLIYAIEDYMIAKNYPELIDAIVATKMPINRIAQSIAAKKQGETLRIISVSLKSFDVIIKLKALQLLTRLSPISSQQEILSQFLSDKSVLIRKQALYHLVTEFPSNCCEVLTAFLFDNSRSIRDLARYYLKTSPEKIVNIYRDALISKKRLLHIAIMGLAEVGAQQDFALIEPYLLSDCIKLKKSAIYALLRLKPAHQQELLLKQLPTEQPGIIRIIYEGLLQDSQCFNLEELEQKFCQTGEHSKYLFTKLKLACLMDRWDKLNFIINRLLQEQNVKIIDFLLKSIFIWIQRNSPNKVFTKANPKTVVELTTKINCLISKNIETRLLESLKLNISYFL